MLIQAVRWYLAAAEQGDVDDLGLREDLLTLPLDED
jgi:hypothetical protein